jgi:hypothetical protein
MGKLVFAAVLAEIVPRAILAIAIGMKEASLANIRFDANYERAIEAEQIEEQKRYELIQAQRQAEIAAATAKGKGDAAREEARGGAVPFIQIPTPGEGRR